MTTLGCKREIYSSNCVLIKAECMDEILGQSPSKYFSNMMWTMPFSTYFHFNEIFSYGA
jgi:hypothetical protein